MPLTFGAHNLPQFPNELHYDEDAPNKLIDLGCLIININLIHGNILTNIFKIYISSSQRNSNTNEHKNLEFGQKKNTQNSFAYKIPTNYLKYFHIKFIIIQLTKINWLQHLCWPQFKPTAMLLRACN